MSDRSPPTASHARAPEDEPLVLLACSSGGHLAQLLSLRPWWQQRRRLWVTFDTADAVSLLADEDVVWCHRPTTRNLPNLLRNTRLAWRLMRDRRPALVVSNGAGVALPFFVLARLMRIPSIYIEIYERFESHPTLTGRLCRPFATRFLLQWPEQRRLHPGGEVIGPLL
jgi:UDP-N-acetylglucosamine:LPS N-acetylglucosamine transferase